MGLAQRFKGASNLAVQPLSALLIPLVCIVLVGCKAPPTWSAEASSPDGKMIANATTFSQSGFGTGFVQTSVYLNWIEGSQPKMLILAFSDGPNEPGGMNVGMKWLDPKHLELSYKGQRPLDFQAVRCDGINISIQESLRSPGNTLAPQ